MVYFVGPVHGHEVEGLTGLMNLIAVMETGRDLRGKEQPELRRLAEQCRLLIVPSGNPDGTGPLRAAGDQRHGDRRVPVLGAWAPGPTTASPSGPTRSGSIRGSGPKIGFMGCYFNDKGINPMHDEFFAPMSTEAPAILRVAADEGPDLAVSLHSCAWVPPSSARPMCRWRSRRTRRRAGRAVTTPCWSAAVCRTTRPFTPTAEGDGKGPLEPFNLISAVYHVSGATAFTLECPHGVTGDKPCHVTMDQIVDIQLTLYEAMMSHELELKAKAAGDK